MIFSVEFDHSQPSVTNCLVNVTQCFIISQSKYVPYILSLVMIQSSCLKVDFIFPGFKNYSLLPYFGQVCSFLTLVAIPCD